MERITGQTKWTNRCENYEMLRYFSKINHILPIWWHVITVDVPRINHFVSPSHATNFSMWLCLTFIVSNKWLLTWDVHSKILITIECNVGGAYGCAHDTMILTFYADQTKTQSQIFWNKKIIPSICYLIEANGIVITGCSTMQCIDLYSDSTVTQPSHLLDPTGNYVWTTDPKKIS